MKKLSFFKKGFAKLFQRTHFFIQLNQKDKKLNRIESGRSMTEMLGVLAVVGVLSVGGILGYKYGITKWKANETINELNLRAHDISFRMEKLIELNHTGEIEMEMGKVTRLGYPIMARMSPQYIDYFEIFLSDVPSDVCKELLKSQWQAPYSIFVDVTEYEASADICEQAEEVELAYEFYKDLSRKEDVPEETRHKIQRCNHDNNCQCGTCNTDAGLCESYCLEAESCTKDYNDPRGMVCCNKDYVVGGYCCSSVTADGKCCNRNGKCCPADKPLLDKDGKCHACDELTNVDVGTHEEYCAACPKRRVMGGWQKRNFCSLCGAAGTPVADKPLIYDASPTTCESCAFDREICQTDIKAEYLCKNVCPGRVLIHREGPTGDTRCVIPCPADKPLRIGVGSCAIWEDYTDADFCTTCDYNGNPYSVWQQPTCKDVCSNREDKNGRCVLSACPAKTPILDKSGLCHTCEENSAISADKKECDKCTTREMKDGYCILSTCPEDKLLRDKNGKCYSCDTANGIDVGKHDEYCNACKERRLMGGWNNQNWCSLCGVKGSTVEKKPLFNDVDGKCYACSATEAPYQITLKDQKDICENVCLNRQLVKEQGTSSYERCVLPCPADKPLRNGYLSNSCTTCDYAGSPYSAWQKPSCSAVCSDREDKDGLCVQICKTETPLRDKSGLCHACAEEAAISADKTECDKCSTREMKNGYCVLSACPEDKPLKDKNGACHACDELNNIDVGTHTEYCDVCEDRYLAGGYNGRNFCSLCGVEGTDVSGKPLIFDDSPTTCQSCSYNNVVYQAGIKSEYLCENVCPGRDLVYEGSYARCSVRCATNTPLRTGINSCTTCAYTGSPSSAWQKPSCSEACPNRKDENGKCVLSGECTAGHFMGKDQLCYSCKITTPIAVADEESCKICVNRLYEDGMCIENTQ